MPYKVQVGPHQISIHQGQTVLISEPDGRIDWRTKGIRQPGPGVSDEQFAAARHFLFGGTFSWPVMVARGAALDHNIAALAAFCARQGVELAPHGIRCNAICPGAVDTGMVNWQGMYDMFAGHPGGTRDDLLAGGRLYHALKGFGVLNPQVIADAALWLVSDGAAAVTGVVLPVDVGHRLLTPINPAPALT